MPDYTVGGFKGSIKEISEHFGVKYETIINRRYLGWTLEEAVGLVDRERKPKYKKVFEVGGFVGTKKEIASHFGINYGTFIERLKLGWTLEEAVGIDPRPNQYEYTVGKFTGNLKEVSEHFGINYSLLRNRLYRGWAIEEAVGIAGRGLNEITKYSLDGVEGSISELCTHFGIVYASLAYSRLKAGWSLRRAITEPRNEPFRKPEVFEVGGFKGSKVEIAKHFGVKYDVLLCRLRLGWTLEEAVGLIERPIKTEQFQVGSFVGTRKEIAEHFGVNYNVLKHRLREGWTPEEAVGLVERERTPKYEIDGVKGSGREIAEHFGVDYGLFRSRISGGWTPEEAVGLVEREKSIRGEVFEVGGFSGTKRQIAEHFGINLHTLMSRLNLGWTPEEAVGLVERRVPIVEVLEVGGFKGTRKEIAQHFGIEYNVLCGRLAIGWTLEEAVELVKKHTKRKCKVFEVGGFKGTRKEIAQHFGIKYSTLYYRLKNGWTIEEAVGIKSRNNK